MWWSHPAAEVETTGRQLLFQFPGYDKGARSITFHYALICGLVYIWRFGAHWVAYCVKAIDKVYFLWVNKRYH